MSVIGSKAHLVQPRMSPFGTNRTNRGVPMMSVVPGRPEVAGGWPTTRLTQNGPRAASGRIKIFAIANTIMDIIARQGRQNFRSLDSTADVASRSSCNGGVRLGMDHCIRRSTSQIGRSSRGFQNGRNSSIFGQRFITTFRPAASASRAASSLRTPICIQTTLAPILMASSVTA